MSSISRDIGLFQPDRVVFQKNTLPWYTVGFYNNGSYSSSFQNSNRYVEYDKKVVSIWYTFEGSSGRYAYATVTDLRTKNIQQGFGIASGGGSFNLGNTYISGNTVYQNYINGGNYYSSYNIDTGVLVTGISGTWSSGTIVSPTTNFTCSTGDTFTVGATSVSGYLFAFGVTTYSANQGSVASIVKKNRRELNYIKNNKVFTGSSVITTSSITSSLFDFGTHYSHIRVSENMSSISGLLKFEHTSYGKVGIGFRINSSGSISYVSETDYTIGDNLRNELGTGNLLFSTNKRYIPSINTIETGVYTQEGLNQTSVSLAGIGVYSSSGLVYGNTTWYHITIT